jgi:hypothetical protein
MVKQRVTVGKSGEKVYVVIDPKTNEPMDEIWQQLYNDDLSGGLTRPQIDRIEEWARSRHGPTERWILGLIATIENR